MTPAVGQANPFLGPILDRWRISPELPFGVFHEDGAWTPVSLDGMLHRARRFAALFQARGAGPGATILLIVRHGFDAHAAFVGAMLIGAVPSFLPYPSAKQDHTLYWAQHRTVLTVCRPRMVLVYDELHTAMVECAQGTGADIVPVSLVEDHLAAQIPDPLPAADAVGLLQHSSGTTGLKKAVALSYRSIACQLANYRDALAIDPSAARIVSWLPLYHDMGLISSFLLPMWLGVPIISLDPFVWIATPTLFFDAVEDYRATHAWLPNFAFMHLARRVRTSRNWDLQSLRAVISCSEPCKAAAFDAFLSRYAAWGIRPETLQTCYAMAETVFAVSQSNLAAPVRRLAVDRDCITKLGPVLPPATDVEALILLSNGRPIGGCAVRILREGDFVAEVQIGEICVSGEFLFSGYSNNPIATAAAFHNEWYRTGDLGFLQDGEVFVVGRVKEVIIVNGKNIFVHDIEAAAAQVAGVKPGRLVAFGQYSDRIGSEQLVVVAERDANAAPDAQVLEAINRAVVLEIGIPCADIRLVDPGWLVKTTSGKISRSENARKYASGLATQATERAH